MLKGTIICYQCFVYFDNMEHNIDVLIDDDNCIISSRKKDNWLHLNFNRAWSYSILISYLSHYHFKCMPNINKFKILDFRIELD